GGKSSLSLLCHRFAHSPEQIAVWAGVSSRLGRWRSAVTTPPLGLPRARGPPLRGSLPPRESKTGQLVAAPVPESVEHLPNNAHGFPTSPWVVFVLRCVSKQHQGKHLQSGKCRQYRLFLVLPVRIELTTLP